MLLGLLQGTGSKIDGAEGCQQFGSCYTLEAMRETVQVSSSVYAITGTLKAPSKILGPMKNRAKDSLAKHSRPFGGKCFFPQP